MSKIIVKQIFKSEDILKRDKILKQYILKIMKYSNKI